jgi:molybdopterin-dependent oxidoreductase alpha subunit
MPKRTPSYWGPAGGWGSLYGIARIFAAEVDAPNALFALARQNKPHGFACVSCAWAKPANHHLLEFCENGAKATLWELTSKRCDPAFFAAHRVSALRDWSDYALERQGRLTHPLRYNPNTDRYEPIGWREAFAAIGAELRAIDPKTAVFYASGRASLETAYLYGLFARAYGHNNLPDSSNMCHETTSVALKKAIGSAVGTVTFDDFGKADAFFFFGQNTGSNSPRFLHPLRDAVRRGTKIVTFNPLRERGLERFLDPQNPFEMLTGSETPISSQYLQVKSGGDIAAILGMCKCIFAADDAAKKHGRRVLDAVFIAEHTHGLEAFESQARNASWVEIEAVSGLTRRALEEAARIYIEADSVIAVYGMGLTQHSHGSDSIAMLVNLLLLRGNIGRKGAGICPVRGHSNVQGQRTVGISEKPELAPLDKLAAMFDFEPPRQKGLNTIEACEAICAGGLNAFVGLGGNFIRAVPDRDRMERAWTKLRLTVQIATKLNRSHLVNGKAAYLLPCLGRIEEDAQASGPQTVTIEDSFSSIHASRGVRTPASTHLKSELSIVAGLAQATLATNRNLLWDDWVADYGKVRELIEATYPEEFREFNARMFRPGGFYRGNKARERIWRTTSGKAEFSAPPRLSAVGFEDAAGRYTLITLRSNDQFNTTIYGMSDRLRGLEGARNVLLMNMEDMNAAHLRPGQKVTLLSDMEDGLAREVEGLRLTPYNIPRGCVAGYFPELNALIPLHLHDALSKTPSSKSVPVRIKQRIPNV